MPITNGSGQGGGNGSVWWTIEYGNGKKPKFADKEHPGHGEVVVRDKVEGHDDTPFANIGNNPGFHDGCFRVKLRFRYADWGKLPDRTREMLNQFAKDDDDKGSWFLEIHVPAIQRTYDAGKKEWPDEPFEIVWEW